MAKAKIIIVEDEIIVAKDIAASLKPLGYSVAATVSSAKEALAKVEEVKPDLILMDIRIKGSMDGIEAAEQIKARFRIPVVFLTAYEDESTLARVKNANAFGYLHKPFEDRTLHATIELALYKHAMEIKLLESNEWLETTLRCIDDAVIAADPEGNIRFVNPIAEKLTGQKGVNVLGKKLDEILHLKRGNENVSVEDLVEQAFKQGVTLDGGQGLFLSASGHKLVPIELRASPICCLGERSLGMLVMFNDITERKLAEEREKKYQQRLFNSQRMESLGMLAGGVANDLNNILGHIVDYPDLIMKNIHPDASIRKDLEMIKNSTQKAVDVIRDLLTLGREGPYNPAPVRLDEVVGNYLKSSVFLSMQKYAPLVKVEIHPAPELPSILGSEQDLQRMVINLVSNAFDAMPDGGIMALKTWHEQISEPVDCLFSTMGEGEYVVLQVRDEGKGIEEDAINRIFEPFYSHSNKVCREPTCGLGLAVVYSVVKKHRGFINVRSKVNEGSEITLHLPVAETKQSTWKKGDRSQYIGSETILVVDDNEEENKQTVQLLKSLGYSVLTSHNGQSAIALFEAASRTPGMSIDLVVLDMIMADSMDGLDTYRKILEYNPRQKAIIVCGFSITDRIKEALSLGVGQYLQKPYGIEVIGEAVRTELSKS